MKLNVSKLNIFKLNKIKLHELNAKSRDKNLIRQIVSSISLKVLSVVLGFISVPLVLAKLGQERYGIWSVLLSLAQWVALMDIGIGNGLRNKLSEALARNEQTEAKEYISTAYFTLLTLGLILIILGTPVLFLIDLRDFFNTGLISRPELRNVVIIFFYSIVIYFILSLINQVINALQKNALTSISSLLNSGLFVLALWLIIPKQNLLVTSALYSFGLLFSILLVSLLFYNEYDYLKPSWTSFRRAKINSILGLGLKFFIIQITGVILFSTDNMVITQLFGPDKIVIYNIPFIIFNNIGILINMMMMPIYSSYTEAYSKGELNWIRSKVVLLIKLLPLLILGMGIIVFFFSDIVEIWLRKPMDIPRLLPLAMAVYTVITVWNNIFSFVLGGIGKIRLGMYSTIFIGIINIPLSVLFAKYMGMGILGIVISNIICLSVSSIISPIQVYYFIFSNKQNKTWENLLS